MPVKIGVNGFGRIGRNIVRAVMENKRDDLEVIALNDLAPVETHAHLFAYDSVHGRYGGEVRVEGDGLDLGRGVIRVTAERDPAKLPWDDVDVCLECTGLYVSRDKAAAHLENGSKKVLVSAPCSDADRTIVYGVNHDTLSAEDRIVSNASCTTNCLAPVAKVIDEAFGIEKGFMTTVHAYTGDQPVLDRTHKDMYRARAAALSMIPTSTGAAKAIGLVLPNLDGKLDGAAIRVPTANVSCIDLKCAIKKNATVEEVNAAVKKAAEGELKGILAYSEEPLVSVDFNHDSHSSSFAADGTKIVDGNLLRVMSWYDNEWGFSNRMCDTAVAMG